MNSFFFWQEYATEESQQYKVFATITDNILSFTDQCFFYNSGDFVTSASCVPDAQESSKTEIIHGMHPIEQKDQSIDLNNACVFVEISSPFM